MRKNKLALNYGAALLILLSIAGNAQSQQTLSISSETDSGSLSGNSSTHKLDYRIVDNLGGTNLVEIDLQNGDYWVATSDYDIFTGNISQAAQDEYYVEGIPLPCFSGPWAAAGCLGAAAVTGLYCEIRTGINIRRGQRQCGMSNTVFHVTSISGCGNVSGHCFGPRTSEQEQ
nr:hypothetical protein [Gammaproteobacteria bacterium]